MAGFLFFWVIFAVLMGAWAVGRGRSGWGFGLLSFFFSPILAAIVLLVMKDLKKAEAEDAQRRMDEAKRDQERRDAHERELESIKVLAQPRAPGSVADELVKLAGLRDAGVLTDDEFAAQKAALLAGRPAG